jgi:ATP-dependent Lhr-like helicase
MPPASFHPLVREWFAETYGTPTAVQAAAWPLIEQGEHILALAPTGSGKTLTAFLSAVSRFCPPPAPDGTEPWPADKLTVLYVSPLKALNEDIKRNLLEPLAAIRARFEKAGLVFPALRVETRSGDTPQSERRRFLASPPAILALTPESLAILLHNPRGRQTLSTIKYLILDEIHAVLGNKRGAFLSCQIDRLAINAGEFQRVSLSATIRSPEIAAEFVGGIGRTVHIVAPPAEKRIDFSVEFPGDETGIAYNDTYGKRYAVLIDYILNRISARSTTLVFVDSRRRAERLCYFLNQEWASRIMHNGGGPFEGTIAFTHHGSLSKELRRSVEQRLAGGSLPCVVATASLELGIDIGSVDEVVLAGSPGSVSQALQRIGRSGHGVGSTSRGRLFPFHGMDLLLAAALAGAVKERDIEELRPVENPLDILAQLILALCVEQNQNIEKLYTTLRGFYIFSKLNHESYIHTVRMLAGLGEKGRLRELKPRIWLDKDSGEIGALEGSLLLLYSSGGVIANRGLYSLRLSDGTKIGELDEEFVWERRLGDHFDFGGRGWRIVNICPESVEVIPLESRSDYMPFWKADTVFRSRNLSIRLLAIMDAFEMTHNAVVDSFSQSASSSLKIFLDSQRAAQCGVPLAGSGNVTLEIIDSPESRGDFYSIAIHTFRGGAVNYPFSLALGQELEETLRLRIEVFPNDNAILFLIPRLGFAGGSAVIEEMFRKAIAALNEPGGGGLSLGERLFRNRLESSGVFGAAFREAAERSLLLPKAGFGKRTPLWITRQRSKRLFDALACESGFPVTAEAWRSCLVDSFDMEGFRDLLGAINSGEIALSFFHTRSPSPFSHDMVRQETNALMYEYDERKDMGAATPGGSRHQATLSDKTIAEALGDASLRPNLKRELVDNFVSRLRREIPGWTPEDPLSLCEWVKERIAIPLDEWETLTFSMPEPLKAVLAADPSLEGRIRTLRRNGAAIESVTHREWAAEWENEAPALLGPWLRFEGPVSLLRITKVFGISKAEAEDAVNALFELEETVNDVEIDQSGGLICDRENLDILFRLSRKKARPVIRERPAALLAPFLAMRQGIEITPESSIQKRDKKPWINESGFIAPAKLWETEFFAARLGNYSGEIIDAEIDEGRLLWYGGGKERLGFCRPEDLILVYGENDNSGGPFASLLAGGFFDRPRDFWEIKEAFGRRQGEAGSGNCAAALWQEAWQGRLSSDSFEPVRRGIAFGFNVNSEDQEEASRELAKQPFTPGRPVRLPRALRERWQGGVPVRGRWFSLGLDQAPIDPLDEAWINQERVRLLLRRWGILCRPLLERESRPFSWSSLLPTIRRMELSGELVAGRFFAGINSLQFASPAIAAELDRAESVSGFYWMNAADSASPAGLQVDGLDSRLPGRSANSRLYFQGAGLIAVSNANGKDLHIYIGPADPGMEVLIRQFTLPRTRKIHPEKKILITTINGENAAASEYAPAFLSAGFISDRGKLCCW